jgi:hypothetical protein
MIELGGVWNTSKDTSGLYALQNSRICSESLPVGWNEPSRNTGHTETSCGKDNAIFYQHAVRGSVVVVHCVEAHGRGTYRVSVGDSGYDAHLCIRVQIHLGALEEYVPRCLIVR